ncbi:MAG: asparagine synthetase A [Thermoproteota archaeon]
MSRKTEELNCEKQVLAKKASPVGTEILETPKPLEQLSDSELKRKQCIGRVMTQVLHRFSCEFVDNGFEWMLPVVFSKSTDPLWPDPGASLEKRIEVEIYGETVRTTLSMIMHKMVACSLIYPKLFILSPNVRVEKRERARTGWNSYEFTQLDFEVRNATSKDIRSMVETSMCKVIKSLKEDAKQELTYLQRYDDLKVPEPPFEVYDKGDLERMYGDDWETKLVQEACDPVWVTNIPREFYDFEDLEEGEWDNYDLLLPGYGEVLSGARREWDYQKIITKINRDEVPKENYELLLKLAREGRIKPSAGAGIGIERIVSWIVGAGHIGEAQPFPKIPGTVYEL